jgi:hypothetical protein
MECGCSSLISITMPCIMIAQPSAQTQTALDNASVRQQWGK